MFDLHNSLRFFPKDNLHNGWTIYGLIDMMCDVWKMSYDTKNFELIEVGSFWGESSIIMSSFSFVTKFHSVDLYAREELKERLKPITSFKECIISTEGSEIYSRKIKDNSINMVYIDAMHDYDSVKKDLILWGAKVKQGGFICGHDYCQTFGGVIKAVDEFVAQNGLSIHKVFCDSSFLIRK